MCTKSELNVITKTMAQEYKKLFGTRLRKIVLYGSYACGDYNSESDVDIVEYSRFEIEPFLRHLVEVAADLDLEYGVMVSPSFIPYNDYQKYKETLPYYKNIEKEGIEISA